MKKLITIIVLFFTIKANAHSGGEIDHAIFNICATIFVVILCMGFIIMILKRVLEYRLKNKIIEKGIPETLASSILQTEANESKHVHIKWFSILAGIGTGLFIVNYTQPLGIHSLATMAFCIAFSFLGYFIYLKRSGN